MKIINLVESDFDLYSKNHKMANIYQTVSYSKFMRNIGYETCYLGFINNRNQIIGASLLIYKTVYFGYKIGFMPKGMLLDFTNYDYVQDITALLKKMLYKNKFLKLNIDPMIINCKRDFDGNLIDYNPSFNTIISNLKDAGFKHLGYNKEFEGNRPRFNAVTYLNISNEKMYYKLNKQTRNKINKAKKSGVVIYKSDKYSLNILYEFIKRKSKLPISYYQSLIDSYDSNVEIYLSKIDPIKFVENAKNIYEKELNNNDLLNNKIQSKSTKGKDIRKILNKKMDSDKALGNAHSNLLKATKMYQENPNGEIIGGAIVINNNNRKYLYIEGFNQKYRSYNPNYLLKWELIKEFNKNHYNEFNLNGVSGNFNNLGKYTGLNEMKSGFNSVVIEHIGEFELIINPLIHYLYKKKSKNKK